MDGVHVKATLRSHIRGEDRVYVQERRQPPKLAPRYHDGWPIVWIFRMAHNPESRWQTAIEWMNSFKTHVHDPELLGRIMQEQGTRAIWMIEFCRPSSSHPRDPHGLIDLYSLDGLLIYAPTHLTLHQSARWAEDTSYKRMPVCHELESVESFFKSHHNLDVSQGDWRANMVRMAIPYASTAVTVVAPDGFTLPRAVFEQAGRQSVEVRIVPLSYFPREMVRTLSMPCFVPVENDPVTREFRYVEYAQHVLNEKPSANKELLSAYWQNYGLTGS